MELPELPPRYKWRQGNATYREDWDVFKDDVDIDDQYYYAWVKPNGDVWLNPHWPSREKGMIKIEGAKTQEEGMQLLATRLWLGMPNEE